MWLQVGLSGIGKWTTKRKGRNTFVFPHMPTSFRGFHSDNFGFFEGKFRFSKAAFFSVYDPVEIKNYCKYTL